MSHSLYVLFLVHFLFCSFLHSTTIFIQRTNWYLTLLLLNYTLTSKKPPNWFFLLLDLRYADIYLEFRERSSITSAHWRGMGSLTENADAADVSRGDGGSQVKINDVILEHICWKIPTNNLINVIQRNQRINVIHILTIAVGGCDHQI